MGTQAPSPHEASYHSSSNKACTIDPTLLSFFWSKDSCSLLLSFQSSSSSSSCSSSMNPCSLLLHLSIWWNINYELPQAYVYGLTSLFFLLCFPINCYSLSFFPSLHYARTHEWLHVFRTRTAVFFLANFESLKTKVVNEFDQSYSRDIKR